MYAIGDASRKSGVGIEAIRYYEREGVIPKARRADNGRRVYDQDDVNRLRFLRECRNLGFSLAEAKLLSSLAEGAMQPDACDRVRAMCDQHLATIRQRLSDLLAMEKALAELTANCSLGTIACPALEALRSQSDL